MSQPIIKDGFDLVTEVRLLRWEVNALHKRLDELRETHNANMTSISGNFDEQQKFNKRLLDVDEAAINCASNLNDRLAKIERRKWWAW